MSMLNTNTITIAICDDEVKILRDIESEVKSILFKIGKKAECFSTSVPEDFLQLLKTKKIDILLLDIDMPRISGMEIAKKINECEYDVLIIFITNQETLVYDSFQYHPFAFIRKSRYMDELEITLKRALLELNKKKEYYIFKNTDGIIRILFSDILYFEADGNYVKIVSKDEEEYEHRETLISLESKLEGKGFIRIHKGFLVNQEAVFTMYYDKVILNNKQELPIGRANRDKAKQELMRYLR